jgi:hypothetical protein
MSVVTDYPPSHRGIYGIGYWVLYLSIFAIFLAIVVMGFKNGADGLTSAVASGLLWVLYSAYPGSEQG